MEGGSDLDDCVNASVALEKSGVDILDFSGGFCGYVNPENSRPGYFSDMSSAAREAVRIPVILTGGVRSAKEAEDLLVAGFCDLVGVGRAVLKDSSWALRALESLA
jgi:2,4-dienoyl-CoA reductase-like NADH-dependent reductase (Old Yellow Enzyme family)